jgi:hypothetical protein
MSRSQSELSVARRFYFDKRAVSLGFGLTVLHLLCILGFGIAAFSANWTNLDKPSPPSVAGGVLSAVAGVLGFPLLTISEYFLSRLPSDSWMSMLLRSSVFFVANSAIWGFAAALIVSRWRKENHA